MIIWVVEKPYNPACPVICMDDKQVQLIDEIRECISARSMEDDPEEKITAPVLLHSRRACCSAVFLKPEINPNRVKVLLHDI